MKRNGTGSNSCTIRTWMLDTQPEICVNQNSSFLCTDSDLVFCNSYKDGTSTNREPRQTYKIAEVGYSQLWAKGRRCQTKIPGRRLECFIFLVWVYTVCWVLVLSSWQILQNTRSALRTLVSLAYYTNFLQHIRCPRPYCATITSGFIPFRSVPEWSGFSSIPRRSGELVYPSCVNHTSKRAAL